MSDELPTWVLAAETKEWVGPITVNADGAPTADFEVTVALSTARPAGWSAAYEMDDESLGVLVGAGTGYTLQAGKKYAVWIRFADSPEIPVQRIGYIKAF